MSASFDPKQPGSDQARSVAKLRDRFESLGPKTPAEQPHQRCNSERWSDEHHREWVPFTLPNVIPSKSDAKALDVQSPPSSLSAAPNFHRDTHMEAQVELSNRFEALGSAESTRSSHGSEHEDSHGRFSMQKSTPGPTSDMGGVTTAKMGIEASCARAIDLKWPPGTFVVWEDHDMESPNGNDPAMRYGEISGFCCTREGMENYPNLWEKNYLTVTDGVDIHWVPHALVFPLEVADLSRLASHAHASPSPRCSHADEPSHLWDWLSTDTLLTASMVEVELPRGAIAHVIGRGGHGVRALETRLGVIIGVMDGQSGTAMVSLIGPEERLAKARRVVEIVGRGARSLLERLPTVLFPE